jgi:ribonuclease Z
MDEDVERAAETHHSTARQAAELAAAAGVRMLALTHISPRYSGGQVRDEARAAFENVIVPRDFDTVEIPFPERGEPTHIKRPTRSAEASDGASGKSGSHTPTGSAPAGREP